MTKKILLVEDEALIALSEARTIEKYGYEVKTVYSGEDAVAYVDSDPNISLVLMDIDLGDGIDGTEASRRLLENHTLPIVFLTGHSEREYVDGVKQITDYGYVLKNAGEFVLIETINTAFELFKAHQETKETEEKLRLSEAKYHRERDRAQNYLDIAGVMIVAFGPTGKVTLINRKGCSILGYRQEEILGKDWIENFIPARLQEDMREVFNSLLTGNNDSVEYHENSVLTKEGEERYIAWNNILLKNDLGNITGFLSSAEDITERKQTEESLQQALEEKDFLLKELNHRVKNNLTMISSLINLKDSALGDKVDLSDIARQIDAIRIVHEKLFRTGKISRIRIKEYFEELLQTIFSTFTDGRVHIDSSIEDVHVHAKTAISLGLVVNEIATNAVKHGFNLEQDESFFIEFFERDEEGYILKLSNTGKPFPEEVDPKEPDGLGLRLINSLVAQLNADFELEKNPSPQFTFWTNY